ncbi:protein disulfide-isomerase [Clonorchis sinensis]|uniref:Protein disulfide-isomerase n=1 Tax=Clonorchis sinensis TaxID=79923 RepID=G7YC03_CLOSI|nr:protein disulfide-isomerase [Clonorchis sinensis]
MKSFQVNVASRLVDNTATYLIHYCTGKAKAAIEDCVLLLESNSFVEVIDILQTEFGRLHGIAQIFIHRILVRGLIVAEDTDTLRKLIYETHSCRIALTRMGYIADLNNWTNLKWILIWLFKHLRREQAKVPQFLERNLAASSNLYQQLASGVNRVSSRCVDDINRCSKLPRPHFSAVASKALKCPTHGALNHCDVPTRGKRHHRLLHTDSYVKTPTSLTANISSNSVKRVDKGIEFKNTLRFDELNEAEHSISRYVRLKTFPLKFSATYKLNPKPYKKLFSREQVSTVDLLTKYLTEVERILNRHPLVPVLDDPVTADKIRQVAGHDPVRQQHIIKYHRNR